MHLLPCPHCEAEIPVAPSQAGDGVRCPQCQGEVQVPTLGRVRQLPRAETVPSETVVRRRREMSVARRASFLVLGLLAVASLLIAGFCGIRWALMEVPRTTASHIAEIEQQYAEATAAQLIREFEDMDRFGVELAIPFKYRQTELQRQQWGRNALAAASVGGLALLGTIALALIGRGKPSPAASDT